MKFRTSSVALALAFTMTVGTAFAQESPEDGAGDAAAAQAAHAEANAYFQRGEFEAAADAFHAAYEAYPAAELLKSEIVARFKAKQCGAAEHLFEAHKDELAGLPDPDRADLDIIRTDCALERAHAKFRTDDLAGAESALAVAKQHDVQGRKTADIEALETEIDARRNPPIESKTETAQVKQTTPETQEKDVHVQKPAGPVPGRWQRIGGWTLTGIGVGFLGYQTIINLFLQPPRLKEWEDLARSTDRSPADEARLDELDRRLNKWADSEETIWIVGTIFTVGGLVTVLTAPSPRSQTSVGLGPSGVTFTTRF